MHAKITRYRLHSRTQIHNTVRENKPKQKLGKTASLVLTISIFTVGVLFVILFLHLDRTNAISNAIRNTGFLGIIIAIFLMAAFCVIPVPSEFLMVMNMKVFGVWWGILYTWIGAMFGAISVFYMARYFGGHLLVPFITEEKLRKVNHWVSGRRGMGLLLARLVPLPFIVVNYAAGILKSVRAWDYIWTTGIGLLPYDLGSALVFLGFSKKYTAWLIIGGIAVLAIWTIGVFVNRHLIRIHNVTHDT